MGPLLALLSSGIWGVSDFVGGTLARRLHPLGIAGVGQALVLPVLALVVLSLGAASDPLGWVPWVFLAGTVGTVAITCFFGALATGTMGVVSPIASTGVAIPVVIGLLQGERPATVQIGGIAVCIVGIVLAAGPELHARHPDATREGTRSLTLAGVAAVGFGSTLYAIARGSHYSVGMTVLGTRFVEVMVIGAAGLAVRSFGGVRKTDLPILFAMAGAEVTGSGMYAIATRRSLIAIVAVLASLYPAVTALLARYVHDERLRPVQIIGVGAVVAGVALITLG